MDGEATLVDPRPHVDGEIERRRAQLLEPEAELLDEVERQAVAAGRPRRDEWYIELDARARRHDVGERRAAPVPDDCVPERIEPVVRELDSFAAARAPRRRAGIFETNTRASCDTRSLDLELVRQPAHRERPRGNGVLADSLHAAA